jgi:hypothetical protein
MEFRLVDFFDSFVPKSSMNRLILLDLLPWLRLPTLGLSGIITRAIVLVPEELEDLVPSAANGIFSSDTSEISCFSGWCSEWWVVEGRGRLVPDARGVWLELLCAVEYVEDVAS